MLLKSTAVKIHTQKSRLDKHAVKQRKVDLSRPWNKRRAVDAVRGLNCENLLKPGLPHLSHGQRIRANLPRLFGLPVQRCPRLQDLRLRAGSTRVPSPFPATRRLARTPRQASPHCETFSPILLPSLLLACSTLKKQAVRQDVSPATRFKASNRRAFPKIK